MEPINVIVVVDVLAAFSRGSLQDCLYMMDDSPGSANQGTPSLSTACLPGQLVGWFAYAMDVQTPIAIAGITFGAGRDVVPGTEKPRASGELVYDWSAAVPPDQAPGTYRYRLRLQMGSGTRGLMEVDTASLNVQRAW